MTANTITAVQPVRIIVVDDPLYTFNEYIAHRCHLGQPINGEREAFHSYLRGLGLHRYTLAAWDVWWDRFVQFQNAHDEADTRACALV